MAEHLGGKNIGGPTPVAVGPAQKLFDSITVKGECHSIDLVITGLLISTAGAFNASNPTGASKAARSGDDTDKMLDFIFKNVMLRIDESVKLFDGELMSRLRTMFSFMTGRDSSVTGCLVDGVAINISSGATKAFSIRVPIPLSVRDELFPEDGDAYKVGTERLKSGGFFPILQNVSGAVALVNGSATLSALAFDMVPHIDAKGDKYYSGPSWKIETVAAQGAEVASTFLRRAKRHFLLVDSVSQGPYTVHGDVETDQLDAPAIIEGFNANRRNKGGDNSCARATPLIWPRKGLKLNEQDYTPTTVYVKDTGGATPTFISLTHEPLDKTVAKRLEGEAVTDNQGQAVRKAAAAPPSSEGKGVRPRNASILGQHILK